MDIYIRSGAVPMKMHFPYILGRDLAGKIIGSAKHANKFNVGDRVWCIGQGWDGRQGTFSEFATIDECWLNRIPDNVSDEEIVAASLVGITARVGLMKAKIHPGESLFVNGGTGGIGSSVVQMAKILGARLITTAGSDKKVARANELGADLAINYKTQNVVVAVKKFAPDGLNVWWETVRDPDFDRAISLLATHGQTIVMAERDAWPQFPVGPFHSKNCSLLGFIILNSSPEELRTAAKDTNNWMSAGKLKAQIGRVLPLSQAAEAHRLREDSTIKKPAPSPTKLCPSANELDTPSVFEAHLFVAIRPNNATVCGAEDESQ